MDNPMKSLSKIPSTSSKRFILVRRKHKARQFHAGTFMSAATSTFSARRLFWSSAIWRRLSGINSTDHSWPKWKTPLSRSWRSTNERLLTRRSRGTWPARGSARLTWESWWTRFHSSSRGWPSTDHCSLMTLSLHLSHCCDYLYFINLV